MTRHFTLKQDETAANLLPNQMELQRKQQRPNWDLRHHGLETPPRPPPTGLLQDSVLLLEHWGGVYP